MKKWIVVFICCLVAIGVGFFISDIKKNLISKTRFAASTKRHLSSADETQLLQFTKEELEKSLGKIEQLNKELQEALQQKQAEAARYLAAQNNLAKVSQELNEARQAQEELTRLKDSEIPLLKKRIEELSRTEEGRSSEYSKLKQEKAALETVLANVEKDIQKQNAYIDSLRNKIENLDLTLTQKDNETKELQSKLKESNSLRGTDASTIAELESTIKRLKPANR